jgi:hypothetical protein
MPLTVVDGGMLSATNAQYTMFKNRLINGNCTINQRSTALSTNNTYGYFVDRMWGFSGVSTAATFSQISSTGLDGFPNAARAQRNSGNTGTANYYTGQIIESNNLKDLQGQTVTLSFWARCGANFSSASSLAVVSISTGTVADQGLANYIAGTWTGTVNQQTTVTLTTSWQKFTYTATLGSTIQELLVFIGSNTTSGTAGANDYIDVTGWQLEKGSTATAFDYRPYGTELQLCQRYYEKTYAQGVAPGTASVVGYNTNGGLTNLNTAAHGCRGYSSFRVIKRATPTVVCYDINGNNGKVNFPDSTANVTIGYQDQVDSGFIVEASSASSADGRMYWHWTASAEI